jgi:nitrite reductase/ring-hydroxylating ferredoxin subunit
MAEVHVCAHNELADGSVRIVRIKELEVAVIRHSGAYYAYQNYCPHQGGPACEGVRMPRVVDELDSEGNVVGQGFDESDVHIVCPWHGYEFHLSTGVHVGDPRVRLRRFNVVERDGGVYVNI